MVGAIGRHNPFDLIDSNDFYLKRHCLLQRLQMRLPGHLGPSNTFRATF